MAIIEDENLLDNTVAMGDRLLKNFEALAEKHKVIGEVRGKGLFAGIELVADRQTRAPADEKQCAQIVAECAKRQVIIGVTNRSVPGYNNTLTFSPALIATPDHIDEISNAVDESLTAVFG